MLNLMKIYLNKSWTLIVLQNKYMHLISYFIHWYCGVTDCAKFVAPETTLGKFDKIDDIFKLETFAIGFSKNTLTSERGVENSLFFTKVKISGV